MTIFSGEAHCIMANDVIDYAADSIQAEKRAEILSNTTKEDSGDTPNCISKLEESKKIVLSRYDPTYCGPGPKAHADADADCDSIPCDIPDCECGCS